MLRLRHFYLSCIIIIIIIIIITIIIIKALGFYAMCSANALQDRVSTSSVILVSRLTVGLP